MLKSSEKSLGGIRNFNFGGEVILLGGELGNFVGGEGRGEPRKFEIKIKTA